MKRPVKVQTYRLALKRDRVLRLAEATASDPRSVVRIAHAYLEDSPVERMIAIFTNARSVVIGVVELASTGSVSSCSVDVLAVFKAALAANASAIVLAHIHPSGDPTPSADDVAFTRKAVEVGELLRIPIVDHVVVTLDRSYRSMLDMGLLKGGES